MLVVVGGGRRGRSSCAGRRYRTGTRGAIAGRGMGAAAAAGRPAGSAGCLGLPDRHAARAAGGAGRPRDTDGRGSGGGRVRRHRVPAGRRRTAAGGERRGLQRLLARFRHYGHRRPAVILDRRSAGRTPAGRGGRRAAPRRLARRRPAGRASGAAPLGRHRRRRTGGPRHRGAVHPRLQLRAADDAERLQQQHAALPERGPRRHPQRDGARRADRAPRRAAAHAGRDPALDGRLAAAAGRATPWSSRAATTATARPASTRRR